jgi:hypothetical protein
MAKKNISAIPPTFELQLIHFSYMFILRFKIEKKIAYIRSAKREANEANKLKTKSCFWRFLKLDLLDNISFEFLIFTSLVFFVNWHVNLIDIQWESLLQYTKDA